MEIFYICVILVGICIVFFALIWMAVEKKNARDYRLELDEREHELRQVIEDAEQLLNELNNFSGYIVDRLEEKQKSIEDLLARIDEKTGNLSNAEIIQPANNAVDDIKEPDKTEGENTPCSEEAYAGFLQGKKGKLISLDERKNEVIKLYKKGISSTEIARMLNMGKGEIELISRMCK